MEAALGGRPRAGLGLALMGQAEGRAGSPTSSDLACPSSSPTPAQSLSHEEAPQGAWITGKVIKGYA